MTPTKTTTPNRRSSSSRRRHGTTPGAVMILIAVIMMVASPQGPWTVVADWIDPDTPMSARTTQPYQVRRPAIPKDTESSSTTATKQTKRRFRPLYEIMSPAPSAAPSHSTDAPSKAPSEPPTMYPTMQPREFRLVFSDEFNTPGRPFQDGTDPRWTALDKNDYTNDALHYYSPLNAETNEKGELVITSQAKDTDIIGFDDINMKKARVTKHFRSAMLQTWNKFCFTGGIIEAEVTLPGKPNVGGLWPAFWMLGNLARHTYVGSSMHVWPWSSTVCTLKSSYAQRISGCNRVNHYGLEARLGRGAPEIDVFEAQPGNILANHGPFLHMPVGQPFISASFQVAPGRPVNRPGPGWWPGPKQWYNGLVGGANTSLNILFYGNYNHFISDNNVMKDYWSDAISINRQLTDEHFNKSHVYRLEWDVPSGDKAGYLHWFLNGELVFALDGKGVREAGFGADISSEPSYILLNTAISKQWGFPLECASNCDCKKFNCHSQEFQETCGFSDGFCDMMKFDEPKYKINWVRVYQNPNDPLQKVGCSTPERPTRRWIEAHESLYKGENDDRPLKPVQRGGASCDLNAVGITTMACGGEQRGRCTSSKVCECKDGWTGPNCLAHSGFDDILYDQPDSISDVGFFPPKIIPTFLMGGLAALVFFLVMTMVSRNHMKGWTPIPDVELR